MNSSKTVHQKLLGIIQDDFEGCEWFIVAANELMNTLSDITSMANDSTTSVEMITDAIGKIGMGISNVERCLDGVEDCYNKSVELLSDEVSSDN
jgi:hypothetical protein